MGLISKLKELGSDSFFYGVSSVIGQLAGLLLVPFFTKELSPEDYGFLNMITLVIVFLSPVAGLAMDTALFRFFSMEDDEEVKGQLFSTASILKTLTVFIIVLSLLPLFNFLNLKLFESKLTKEIFWLILMSFILENFTSLSAVVLRSQRKVKLIALNSIIYVMVSIGFSVLFVLVLHWGVKGSLIGGVMAGFVKMLLYIRVNRDIFSFSRFSIPKAKEMLAYSLPMVPHKIQGNIIGLFTTFMINQKLGLVYSGYYAVASKVAKPLVFIITMVQQSWTPYKFSIHKNDKNPPKTFSEIISFYWIFLGFLWVILALLTPLVFTWLIDSRYHGAQTYVPFIMFVSIAQAFYFTITTGFELKKDQKKMVLASFLGMASLVALSLLTINFVQPYTFFIIQALSFFILAAVIFPDARKIIHIDYPFAKISIFLLGSVAILILGFYFNYIWLNLILIILFILITLLMFRWVFPQYPLSTIPAKFKSFRAR